jgi:rhodanese-related sulfurtransferase
MKQPVSPDLLREWLQAHGTDVRVIDIRSKEEFQKKHIPASENIPAEIMREQSAGWDKNSVIVCVCNRGHERSQGAAEELSESGFKNIFFLQGGIAGWFEDAT